METLRFMTNQQTATPRAPHAVWCGHDAPANISLGRSVFRHLQYAHVPPNTAGKAAEQRVIELISLILLQVACPIFTTVGAI